MVDEVTKMKLPRFFSSMLKYFWLQSFNPNMLCIAPFFVNGLKAKVTRSSMRTKAVWPVVVGVASRAALFEDTTSEVADQHATHSTGLKIIGFFL